VPDLVMAATSGGGPDHQSSFMLALSGADSAVLWEVLGTSLAGGAPSILVDVKTGQSRQLAADVEFGAPVRVLPDLNGDGVRDLATILPTLVGEKRVRAVLIFSGATGDHIGVLSLARDQGRIYGKDMVLLDSADGEGEIGLAVTALLPPKQHDMAIFLLPDME